ncbi:MAG: hypothetical protein ACLQDQ_12255 [Myxococcaceae bacterium]
MASSKPVATRFFSLPSHLLVPPPRLLPAERIFEPELPAVVGAVDRAIAGAEFRDQRLETRLEQLLSEAERFAAPSADAGPSIILARPPGDLPALLRTADQLESMAVDTDGERALVWKCETCGTRYAVPVALARDVAIHCERCGQPVQLLRTRSLGEQSLMDPHHSAVNVARRALAAFFRESMARGWPVLASRNRS